MLYRVTKVSPSNYRVTVHTNNAWSLVSTNHASYRAALSSLPANSRLYW
jgi:hypothetical protein